MNYDAGKRKRKENMAGHPDAMHRMTDGGWAIITDDGFIGLVGPFFQKIDGSTLHFRFPTADKHHNRRGVLQGGALMTFCDRVMGIAARVAARFDLSATVHLNVHFVDAVEIGELVETSPTVVRVTKHLVFMDATLTVGARTVGVATGIWKMLGQPASNC